MGLEELSQAASPRPSPARLSLVRFRSRVLSFRDFGRRAARVAKRLPLSSLGNLLLSPVYCSYASSQSSKSRKKAVVAVLAFRDLGLWFEGVAKGLLFPQPP